MSADGGGGGGVLLTSTACAEPPTDPETVTSAGLWSAKNSRKRHRSETLITTAWGVRPM